MVICRYYLEGRCRYGNQCRFEHPSKDQGSGYNQQWRGGGGGGGGRNPNQWTRRVGFSEPFPQNQNRFAPLASQQTGTIDKTQILETMKRDMEEWESSNMWIFSSYSLSKTQKTLPGMDDVSPEELRYYTYEAKRLGKFPQYEQNIIQAANNVQRQWNDLKTPDPQLKTNVIQVYLGNHNAPTVFSNSVSTLALLNGSTSDAGLSSMGTSLMGQTQATSGFFGQSVGTGPSSSQSTFGSFGQTGASTLGSFGSSAGSSSQQSSFGGFGKTDTSTTPATFGGFGTQTGSTSTFGSFGNSAGTSSSSTFGSFGSTGVAQSGFGGFGSQDSKALVGGAAPFGGFGTPTAGNTGLFGAQPTSGSIGGFGNAQTASPKSTFGGFGSSSAPQTSLFASTNAGQSLIGASPAAANVSGTHTSKLYTDISALTAQEKEQFEAKSFTLGKIPTRPPPKEFI
ncbi:nucleoporin NUP42-like [Ptychodera flava]|uniref:nucleoporin NUP42-like n=1 Tax=Ptychodera flava TaxID=63121 RepID=UPI003969D208